MVMERWVVTEDYSKSQETKQIGELKALCGPRLDSYPERDLSNSMTKLGNNAA